MNEQIIAQTAEAKYDRMLEQMSAEAKNTLIKMGASWVDIVGSSGSWVSKRQLGKAMEQESPWTANKLTDRGRGRNGVTWSLIPLLKSYNLVTVINGTHTRYMLNPIGKEVLSAMLYNCSFCNTTRECQCEDGLSHHHDGTIQTCSHINRQDCQYCDGSGRSNDGDYDCRRCTVGQCEYCDDQRNRYCYSCKGSMICNHCKGVDLDE